MTRQQESNCVSIDEIHMDTHTHTGKKKWKLLDLMDLSAHQGHAAFQHTKNERVISSNHKYSIMTLCVVRESERKADSWGRCDSFYLNHGKQIGRKLFSVICRWVRRGGTPLTEPTSFYVCIGRRTFSFFDIFQKQMTLTFTNWKEKENNKGHLHVRV